MYKKDGHIHTPYCPHGTSDPLINYIEKAISLGFNEITFTEHAPLPVGFIDTTPTKDSSISFETLPHYLEEVYLAKEKFQNKIKVNVGLEIDYIEGFDNEIADFLATWGDKLDDSILSVHFLKCKQDQKYDCIDYSPELFGQIIERFGSIEHIYDCYFHTLAQSITADLGPYKPKRIGHMTLIHKFQKAYQVQKNYSTTIHKLLYKIKEQGYELDYNGAGLFKPLCLEPYPPDWIVHEARHLQIPLIYGSDAHQVKDLGQGWNSMLWND